jgi:hypothetical protein
MTFILVIAIFLLGVGFHVTQTVDRLRKKFPQFGIGEIMETYFKEEWNTLIRSFLVMCTYLLFLFILSTAQVNMPIWWDKYLVPYGLSLILGYAGQRLIYKYLSTAEKALENKADNLNSKP